jgi:hypothetical protein
MERIDELIKKVYNKLTKNKTLDEFNFVLEPNEDGFDHVVHVSGPLGKNPHPRGSYKYWKWESMNTSNDPDVRDRARGKMEDYDIKNDVNYN